MRQRSFAGPILLIGIGAFFLLNNLRPDLPILSLLSTYWPFVLIGWGLFRLAEILNWHTQGRPLPRFGISGGEWTLAIVLTILGTSVLYGGRMNHNWPRGFRMRGLEMLGEPFDYPVSGSKMAKTTTPRVIIESFRGNVRIVGTDSNEVKVSGSKQIRSFNRSEADRSDKVTPFEMVDQGNVIIIRMNHDRVADSAQVKIDFDLKVPRGTSIEGRGRYGDFDVNDIQGGVDINSDNAGVRLANIGGPVRLDLRRSDSIRVSNARNSVEVKSGRGNDLEFENIEGTLTVNGNYTGDMQFRSIQKTFRFESARTTFRIEKIPGTVRISSGNISGSNLTGPIQLTSNSKDVELSDFTNSLEVSVDRGDLEIRPGRLPMGKIDATTRSGRVDISLPPAARFELSATTDKGEVENEWGDPLKAEEQGRRAKLTGSTGQGPVITAHTNRGNVTIRKAAAESKAPVPPVTPAPPAAPKPAGETQL